MGYYTTYTLTFDELMPAAKEVVDWMEFNDLKNLSFAQLRKQLPDPMAHFQKMEEVEARMPVVEALDLIKQIWNTESDGIKWYNHEADMRAFSKAFPDVVFKLGGCGEESEDIWAKYFQNGKMQLCKAVITIEPFDPKKLK